MTKEELFKITNGFTGAQISNGIHANFEGLVDDIELRNVGYTEYGGSIDSLSLPQAAIEMLTYGVEWDVTVSDPQLTRIGNPLLHKSLPIQSKMKGCIWDPGLRKIAYYLDPNDWSKKEDGTASVLDGTDGYVRVEIPEFYGKSESDGNKRRVRISETKIDDTWTRIPHMVVDAYRCTLDTSTSTIKAVSVVNTTASFRGGNNRTSYDTYLNTDPFRSDLGKPRTSQTRANMRKYARNAGSELLSYEQYKWIFYWLYVIEYANFNSQAAFNENLTSDGYHQGGLGTGVTNINGDYWNYYNGYYPLIPCGYCNDIGNFTGVKQAQLLLPTTSGAEPSYTHTFQVPRWRGFDNPFGDIWTNLDGVIIDANDHGDNMDYVYICKDPDKYADTLTDDYIKIANSIHTGGFVKAFDLGTTGEIIANQIGGTSTTYMCDYHYTGAQNNSLRTLFVGGGAYYGADSGLADLRSNSAVSLVATDVGVRSVAVLAD